MEALPLTLQVRYVQIVSVLYIQFKFGGAMVIPLERAFEAHETRSLLDEYLRLIKRYPWLHRNELFRDALMRLIVKAPIVYRSALRSYAPDTPDTYGFEWLSDPNPHVFKIQLYHEYYALTRAAFFDSSNRPEDKRALIAAANFYLSIVSHIAYDENREVVCFPPPLQAPQSKGKKRGHLPLVLGKPKLLPYRRGSTLPNLVIIQGGKKNAS